MFRIKDSFYNKAHFILAILIALNLFVGCADKKETTKEASSEPEATDSQSIASNNVGPDIYYYGNQTHSLMEHEMYNYEFVHFKVDSDGTVNGVFYSSPYGTDGSKGSFKGKMDMDTKVLKVTRNYLAEGERYQQDETYTILDSALDLGFKGPDGSTATMNRLSAEEYNTLFKAYEEQELHANLNISDREHLSKLKSLISEMNYSPADVENLKFMERMVELDNDPSTQEYLLYVMDPMLCGSGGCNLYILNDKGKEIGRLSVTRPPIYLERHSFEESMNKKGQWKTFYVFSDGMRRVEAKNGVYPSNPSVETEIELEMLKDFPEKYQLVMDYLE